MNNGWIKIHRRLLEWEWSDDPNMVALWIHLLLNANFEDSKWHGTIVPRGSFITSQSELTKKTGLSRRSLRTCIDRLKSTNEISVKTTKLYSVITICKYDSYQLCKLEGDTPPTNERPTGDQPIIEENKEGQEKKKGNSKRVSKKEFSIPTREQIEEYAGQIGSHINVTDFINYYEATEWKVKDKPMQNWKLVVQTWTRIDRERRPHLYQEQQETKEKQTESKWQG